MKNNVDSEGSNFIDDSKSISRQKKVLVGRIFTGLGKGAFFVSLDEYKQFFAKLLGRNPYPGTLNVRLENAKWSNIAMEIFKPRNGFGAIYFRKGLLNGETIVIIRPALSRHDDNVIEIVAADNLRRKYGLMDGDQIELIVVDI